MTKYEAITRVTIFELLKSHPEITIREISSSLSISKSSIQKHIKKLQEINYIRYIGSGRNGHWEIVEEKEKHTEKRPEKWPEKASQIIKLISQNASITIPELESELNIGHTTLKKILKALQDEKFIIRVGPDKGGHWEVIEKY